MAKIIMVQGTTSGAGKSILTAALCRIFRQDGYRVAPFKSQNMALNSFVTPDGLEIGRAQAMQAEAAGLAPSTLMNPILLKPNSHTGSQVIVNGEVLGNMPAREYFAYKTQLIPVIKEAFQQLAQTVDIIVIEGAGSPAEINLKQNDIVNMGLAALVDAPVLIVGDIDKGGVFASLYGTLELLTPEERARVKGLVINKFRGDVGILKPGLTMMEELGGIPVVGVVPMLKVDVDDEDSLSDRFQQYNKDGLVDIAVIRLPHIANFTDFNRLQQTKEVNLYYVDHPLQMGRPDLIILPGSKNTLDDLAWLQQTGLAEQIKQLSRLCTPVFGICGGYQMLGLTLSDPHGVEKGGTAEGLGLLPIETVFDLAKKRTLVLGRVASIGGLFGSLSGLPFEGYEIHMGQSTGGAAFSFINAEECSLLTDGAWQGNIYGSYVHGLFDKKEIIEALVATLLQIKGLTMTMASVPDAKRYREEQYDLLAEGVRANLDMEAIYDILGIIKAEN